MKKQLLAAALVLAPLAALASASYPVTVNLCNEFPYVKAGGVNITALVRPYCQPGQVIPMTVDLCGQNPRLYGYGDHDKNAFAQATGQCS